jgi:hypothetical protein
VQPDGTSVTDQIVFRGVQFHDAKKRDEFVGRCPASPERLKTGCGGARTVPVRSALTKGELTNYPEADVLLGNDLSPWDCLQLKTDHLIVVRILSRFNASTLQRFNGLIATFNYSWLSFLQCQFVYFVYFVVKWCQSCCFRIRISGQPHSIDPVTQTEPRSRSARLAL